MPEYYTDTVFAGVQTDEYTIRYQTKCGTWHVAYVTAECVEVAEDVLLHSVDRANIQRVQKGYIRS